MAGRHDWRPLTKSLGTTTEVKFDSDGGTVIRTVGDEVPRLEMNKVLRGMAGDDGGYVSTAREMKRVASIPASLVAKWFAEEGLDVYNPDHAERLMRKLNDPDYVYLRTAPGQLGPINGGEAFR